MKPADIDTYTREVGDLLKDASYARVQSEVHAYEAGKPVEVTPGKQTFFWGCAWTQKLKEQEQGWKAVFMGFELAMAAIYPGHRIVKFEFQVEPWRMYPVILHQIYAKARRTIRGDLTFLEADVVPNKPCNPYADNDFDIGLTDTANRWPMMPFNGGVTFSKDTPGAQKFWDTVMEYCSSFPQNGDPWYLTQLAVSHAYLVLKDKIKIKIFPHEEYNYVPEVYAPSDAYYVHLKGHRKSFHRDYVLPIIDGKQGQLYVPPQKEGIIKP